MIIFPNVLGSSCHYTSLIISPLNSFLSTYSLNGEITHNFYSITISLLVYGLPLPPTSVVSFRKSGPIFFVLPMNPSAVRPTVNAFGSGLIQWWRWPPSIHQGCCWIVNLGWIPSWNIFSICLHLPVTSCRSAECLLLCTRLFNIMYLGSGKSVSPMFIKNRNVFLFLLPTIVLNFWDKEDRKVFNLLKSKFQDPTVNITSVSLYMCLCF